MYKKNIIDSQNVGHNWIILLLWLSYNMIMNFIQTTFLLELWFTKACLILKWQKYAMKVYFLHEKENAFHYEIHYESHNYEIKSQNDDTVCHNYKINKIKNIYFLQYKVNKIVSITFPLKFFFCHNYDLPKIFFLIW